MKKNTLIILLTILVLVYLNRSYTKFYDYLKLHPLFPPNYPTTQTLNKNNSNTYKFVMLGDSLMAGTGSSNNQNTLSYQIAKNMVRKYNVYLINLAKPGATVETVFNTQVPTAIREKPDYIFILLGINDVHSLELPSSFGEKYLKLLNLLSKSYTKIVIINIPFLGSNQILLPPWNILLDLRTKQFNNILKQISNEKNIKYIDLYGNFRNQFKNNSNLYSIDQFHPSDRGYELWANYIDANSSL